MGNGEGRREKGEAVITRLDFRVEYLPYVFIKVVGGGGGNYAVRCKAPDKFD